MCVWGGKGGVHVWVCMYVGEGVGVNACMFVCVYMCVFLVLCHSTHVLMDIYCSSGNIRNL